MLISTPRGYCVSPDSDSSPISYRLCYSWLMGWDTNPCVPLLVFALLLKNPRLEDKQSLPEAEGYVSEDAESLEEKKVPVV